MLVWQRIIMPDGSSIQIDNLPATDAEGYSGLEDQVDYHTWALIKGVAISTLLGVGSELALAVSMVKRVREVLCGLPSLASWQWLEARRLTVKRPA